MKNSLFSIGLLLSLFFLTACSTDDDDLSIAPDAASLVVHIYGSLSGDDRESISVSLHATKQDADDNKRAITSSVSTNVEGIASFYGLDPNLVYWVRAKAALSKTVRPTNRLAIGENYIEIPIL